MSATAELLNAQRQYQDTGATYSRSGTISGYDPGSHCVKVTIQPDGYDTGWIQLAAIGVGNGWGVLTGPQIGDEVCVTFDGGDPQLGKVTGRYFNDDRPPPAVPAGETWVLHESGSLLKFLNDGSVELVANTTLNATAQTANVTATVSANVTAPAINLKASGQTLRKLVMETFQALFNGHTHASGGAGVPNQQMDNSHMTTTVKGA